ncbi:MAG: GNAT family N-acetyltransferase [Prevotella sp.]|nr:GNAT family N-acetyltransferase [Prevotella sp.]MBS5527922.1 GNAT family N-acetyltransferase [Prevotella sp.]
MSNNCILPDIRLRAIEPEDLDILYKIENDEMLWDVGVNNIYYSRYILHEYIANAKGDIYTDRQARLIIENNIHDVVGIVDIVDFDPKHLRAEIGIVIQNKYRHMGYAKAAISHIIKYAKNVLHLHQLYAYVNSDNTTSIKMFDNAGFTQSAELKDWLYDGSKHHNAVIMQYFIKKNRI